MSNLSTLLLKFPIIIGTTLGLATTALAVNETPSPEATESFSTLEIANTPTDSDSDAMSQFTGVSQLVDSSETDPMSQVNSVSQFRDVSPRDWAYQALRGLVERYGCIAGYPNGTFRGNRALTRYEFAAGLFSCLTQIERLIAASTADFITQEDLATLERLIQEFEAEIATLGTRVDNLEARLGFLEENQFSTTTKLAGEVIFSFADAFGGPDDAFGDTAGENINPVFHDRVRLNFLTSFTGRDLLQTRLQAGNPGVLLNNANVAELAGTQEGRFTYDGPNNNDVVLDILRYIFPLGDQATVQIIANNGLHHYYADTLNPYFEGRAGGENAISRFAERNPIYRIGPFGAGAAIAYRPFDKVRIDVGYLSNTANDPGDDRGIFGGNYSGIAQVVLGDQYKVGLTYVRGRENNLTNTTPPTFSNNRLLLGGTGTALANLNRNALANATTLPITAFNTTVETNSYGIETSLRFSPKFIVNGWVGYTDAELEDVGDADIWNFAVTLGFPDFGKEGSLLGLVGGAAPTLRDLDIDAGVGTVTGFNRDFAYHVEGFYKYQLTNNISVTPGVIWLLNPNQNENNDDVFIGTVRTTFTF